MADTKAFINKIAPLAQAERKKREKWVLPSVCIAQAALETGWGTSKLMTKANAFFGIKAGKTWKGKVYNTRTKECYDGRNFVNVQVCFRAYDNLKDSIADYYDLICGNSCYAGAVNNSDYKATITAIKNGGYATDPNYIGNVCAIIKKYNLTKYDAVSNAAASGGSTAAESGSAPVHYKVVKGDTLSGIAKKYKTTVKRLKEVNGIEDANKIYAGQEIVIK